MANDEHNRDGDAAKAAEGDDRAVHLGSADQHHDHEPIEFSGFVLSLAQAAMIDMGVAPHPEHGKLPANLKMACETIDILAMLKDKTAGNLDAKETKLLEGVLYQLRMSFLDCKKERQ